MLSPTATPTPTPVHTHEPGGFLLVIATVFVLAGSFVVGIGAGLGTVATRYGTGLEGVNRLARAVLGRTTGTDTAGRLRRSPVAMELVTYVLLAGLFATVLYGGRAHEVFEDVGLSDGQLLTWYTAAFVAATWIVGVVVLSWLDSGARTELPIVVGLAAEFGIFAIAMWAAGTVLTGTPILSGPLHGAAIVLLPAGAALGILSMAARRVESAPEPGDRAYAAGVIAIGAAVAGVGLLLGTTGLGALGRLPLTVGGALLALGLLAALATVE